MRRSSRVSPRGLRGLAGVVAVVLLGTASLVARAAKEQDAKADQPQRNELQVIIPAVDQAASGQQPANATLPLTWEHQDFVKAQQEKTYVPFTVVIDPSVPVGGQAAVYVRAVKRGDGEPAAQPTSTSGKKAADASKYAFEDLTFVDLPPAEAGTPRRIRRAFAVVPGEYDVYVAVRARPAAAAPAATSTDQNSAAPAPAASNGTSTAPAEAPASTTGTVPTAGEKQAETPGSGAAASPSLLGIVKQAVSVPDFNGPELTTSSIIIADKVDVLQTPISDVRQAENPYTFGAMRIEPSAENKFSRKSELSVVFWIYGAAADPGTKKPDVNIEFKFYQKNGDKETYFNKTDPQVLNAQTLPPTFDPAAGHQLPGSLAVGLASFPEGQYRLEIEVTDKVANKTVKRDVGLTVTS